MTFYFQSFEDRDCETFRNKKGNLNTNLFSQGIQNKCQILNNCRRLLQKRKISEFVLARLKTRKSNENLKVPLVEMVEIN